MVHVHIDMVHVQIDDLGMVHVRIDIHTFVIRTELFHLPLLTHTHANTKTHTKHKHIAYRIVTVGCPWCK